MNSLDLMRAIWPREDLDAKEKTTLLALLQHVDERLRCWPSIARLAIYTSLKRRALQYAVASLERRGFIQVHRGAGQAGASVYVLKPQSWPKAQTQTHQEQEALPDDPHIADQGAAMGGAPHARGVHDVHWGGARHAPKLPIELPIGGGGRAHTSAREASLEDSTELEPHREADAIPAEIGEAEAHAESTDHPPPAAVSEPATHDPAQRCAQRVETATSAPAPHASGSDPAAPTWREQLILAMGHTLPGINANGQLICGQADMHEARRWREDLGLTDAEILQEIGDVMATKRDGPPATLRYFRAPMQRLAAAKIERLKIEGQHHEHADRPGDARVVPFQPRIQRPARARQPAPDPWLAAARAIQDED